MNDRRQDVIRNESAILEAAGELLREDPSTATMPAIARRARLSTATAYRYFDSLESLHRRYILRVVEQLAEFSINCPSEGRELLTEVLYRWLLIVRQYGPAMVAIRSRSGFLNRLSAGDELASLLERSWGRPVRDLMMEYNVPDEHFLHALAVLNALFNSRELLDGDTELGLSDNDFVDRMARLYCGALSGLSV